MADWCAQLQREPEARVEVRAGQTACALAACGAGIAVVDDLTARGCMTDRLDFRPINGAPSFEIHAVGHGGVAASMLAQQFVAHAEMALRQLRQAV